MFDTEKLVVEIKPIESELDEGRHDVRMRTFIYDRIWLVFGDGSKLLIRLDVPSPQESLDKEESRGLASKSLAGTWFNALSMGLYAFASDSINWDFE